MQENLPDVYFALPSMNEADYLPGLINCLEKQDYKGSYHLVVCINQPDSWWSQDDKIHICKNNKKSEELLKDIFKFPIVIIDRYTNGNGWKGKQYGVGWARKTVMDEINKLAHPQDIIISIDADTVFNNQYISSVVNNIMDNPGKIALSVPYYHNLTDDAILNRAILRYEIYMRYYCLNLWRIASPYNFTALGSAIALPVWAYRKIGGISPHKSGEDFYFLQKLRKTGELILWNSQKVYPASRYSDRVFFGTGPAMIKGKENNWTSYPFYHFKYFDEVKELYDLFPALMDKDVDLPIIRFMESLFSTENLWSPIRKNYKNREKFVDACIKKIDALRILQYLKTKNDKANIDDEKNLIEYLEVYYDKNDLSKLGFDIKKLSFSETSINILNKLRDFLAEKEEYLQKNSFFCQ